jgi:hypothetical protein
MLMGLGALLLVTGGVLWLVARVWPGPGRLPGDVVVVREGFTLYAPFATMLLVSLALTGILWLVNTFRR